MTVRLLFDHQIFDAQAYGGISRYFYELISRASRDPRLRTQVFMGAFINQYGTEKLSFDRFFGVKRPVIKKTGRIFGHVNQALFRNITSSWAPDLYHMTYFRNLKPKFKARTVLTVYDMIHEIYPKYFPDTDPTRAQKRWAVDSADRLIAISHSTKNDIVRLYGTSPEKIDVIHLANSLKKTDRTVKPPGFLFVGSRGGYKSFDLLLRAFAKCKTSLQVTAYGGGPFTDSENKLITDLGIRDRVTQVPAGSDEELAAYYQAATAFIYPSLYEGFGIPILEAMHLGTPVIICPSSSLGEIGGDAALYFETGQVDSLAETLGKVGALPRLREEFIQKGFKREKEFSWDKTFQETLGSYERTLRS